MTIRIVGVSGSLTAPSRTTALVAAVVDHLGARLSAEARVETRVIELAGLLPALAAGTGRDQLGEEAREALAAVEGADVVVAGSPAYRAAYTGIFKHFFDYIGQYALVDKPIVLTATGGAARHALLVEHQMRPLFGFFQALTLPLGIFGNESDFTDYQVSSTELLDRIELSTGRAFPLLTYQLRSAGRLKADDARDAEPSPAAARPEPTAAHVSPVPIDAAPPAADDDVPADPERVEAARWA